MAGLIPQSFIDDLLSRADIVDVVDSRVTLKKTGKNYSGLCPFHKEKSPSFSVEPEKQFYYCFGCGAGGNAIGFVMNYENLDFPQAIESLATSMGIEVPREESAIAQQQREKNQGLYEILKKTSAYYQTQLRQHPQKSRAIEYLKSRGLSGEIARDFDLGYAPPGWQNLIGELGSDSNKKSLLLNSGMLIEKPENTKNPIYDRFRDRIMYPIKDKRGRVIAFGGRVLGDDKPKYLNSPETPVFHKGEELYGLYEARKKVRKLERILIVEGYMDVIALAQNDIHYCVATLGTATSTNHLRQLFKLVPEVVFCFDGDSAGRDAAWRALLQAIPLMEDGRSARFLFLPDGEDPDSQVRKIGSKDFVINIGQATQLAEFFFDNLGSQVDMLSLEGRAKLGTIAMPHIKQLPQGIFRQLIISQLAQITGVDEQTLATLDNKQTSEPNRAQQSPTTEPPQNHDIINIDIDGDAPPPWLEEEPSPNRSRPVRTKKTGRSACMKAVNLILLQPSLVSSLTPDLALLEFKEQDIELLQKVIEIAKSHPDSSTPQLMGRIYATPLGSQLIQLLDREQITPRAGIEKEFKEIIQHLEKTHQRKKSSSSLLEKARQKLHSLRQTQENKNIEQNQD